MKRAIDLKKQREYKNVNDQEWMKEEIQYSNFKSEKQLIRPVAGVRK